MESTWKKCNVPELCFVFEIRQPFRVTRLCVSFCSFCESNIISMRDRGELTDVSLGFLGVACLPGYRQSKRSSDDNTSQERQATVKHLKDEVG